MNGCIFCGIAGGTVPADVVLDEDDVIAFRDLNPQAPTHVLVIPRQHLESAAAVGSEHHALWGRMLDAAQRIASQEGVADGGYRLVANVGSDGGQTVGHLHLHVLGGRQLHWPPG